MTIRPLCTLHCFVRFYFITSLSNSLGRQPTTARPSGEKLLVGYRRDQWAVLVSNRNRDQRWTSAFSASANASLISALVLARTLGQPKPLQWNDVQAGKVQGGDIWRFLQNGKFFEDGLLAVARHNVDDLQLVLDCGI